MIQFLVTGSRHGVRSSILFEALCITKRSRLLVQLNCKMSMNDGEPPSKRWCGEMGSGERTITLNMNNYDRSVQNYSDKELIQIFELGLKIKESADLSINFTPKTVEDAIYTEMEPDHEKLDECIQTLGSISKSLEKPS